MGLREGLNKIIIYFFRKKIIIFHIWHQKVMKWRFLSRISLENLGLNICEDICNYDLDKCGQVLRSRYSRDFPGFQDGRRRHLGFRNGGYGWRLASSRSDEWRVWGFQDCACLKYMF